MERLEQTAAPAGRRGECALIGAFLDRANADGAALLVRGEPGAGKTVLLDAVAGAAINETVSDWEVHNERARTGHR